MGRVVQGQCRPCRKLIAVCADASFASAQVELAAGWLSVAMQ